jgi:lipopolysaccharide transport system permease protein
MGAGAAPAGGGAWVEIRPPRRGWPSLGLGELWAHRELAGLLALRDLKVRYRQTAFGVAWALVQPIAGVALFSVLFGHLAHLPADGLPYPVFVVVGLVAFTYVSSGVAEASESLVVHYDLVTKVYFPRMLAPFAALLPGLVDLLISLGIVAVLMAAYSTAPGPALVLLPAWIAGLLLVALGPALWLAALHVRYRDVRHASGFLIQLWLYGSPILFPASLVPHAWRALFAANPMVGAIEAGRWILVDGPRPGWEIAVSAASAVAILISGAAYFRRAEPAFADVI